MTTHDSPSSDLNLRRIWRADRHHDLMTVGANRLWAVRLQLRLQDGAVLIGVI